jgi:tripartite-type tricarboxylate transporter receptor subunit TctC
MIARRAFLAGLLAALGSRAAAQTYPSRAIRMITPFTPGGPVDVAARLLAQQLGAGLGQPVIMGDRSTGRRADGRAPLSVIFVQALQLERGCSMLSVDDDA